MRPLIIDDETKKMAAIVVKYATDHAISVERMRWLVSHPKEAALDAPGNNPAHVLHIHKGFRCVFTIEGQPFGMCRHLSISVDGGKLPHPAAVEAIGELFGITKGGPKHVSIEEAPDCKAVNIIQPLES